MLVLLQVTSKFECWEQICAPPCTGFIHPLKFWEAVLASNELSPTQSSVSWECLNPFSHRHL